MTVIYWAGDSTVKENNFCRYPQTGIGQEFHRFLKKDVRVSNHGENGRSTKSFLDESRLAPIYNQIREGDFLFIQFGHNDEKIEDESRYTVAFGDYQENLKKMVQAARNKKAYPVFITSVERRIFDDKNNLQIGTHRIYAEAMIELGQTLQVPVIDLNTLSHQLIEKVGPERSKEWFMHLEEKRYPYYPEGLRDNTHLKPEGAVMFGSLIAEELEKLGGIYQQLLCIQE